MSVRPPQPWPVRLTHWLNVPVLVILAGSGLQIFRAYPSLGPRGATWSWYPFQGQPPPEWLTLGGWLAGGRHWHFLFAWALLLNGAVYLGYLVATGEFRRRWFSPGRDAKDAARTALGYLRLRFRHDTGAELYNGLQRLAYTAAVALGLLVVVSGLVMYKPVQLGWLTALVGGYDVARALHLGALLGLALFTVGHVAMVALHPRSLLEMITGGRPR